MQDWKSTNIPRNRFGHFLPTSEAQIVDLINLARKSQRKLRVLGSLHSIRSAIFGDNASQCICLSLDFLNRISIVDANRKVVRVQGGCRMDYDPYSLNGNSTRDNGLVSFLENIGWALPDLGGITHQSVAGFLATGSAGGTLQHSVYDQILQIRFIDGNGRIHELDREDEHFYGSVVALGLWGIITEVKFQCIERFDIIGKESVLKISDAPIQYGVSNSRRKPNIYEFFRSKEYSRIMLWPQQSVEKVVIWEASRMSDSDRERLQHYRPGLLRHKRYRQMGLFPNLANRVAGKFLTLSGNAIFSPTTGKLLRRHKDNLLRMLNLFIVSDDDKTGTQKGCPQYFNDTWWHGLPMDYEMDDEIFPTEFTELWIPAKYAEAAMAALAKHYQAEGAEATGSYCCEIYAAKASEQWLSPAFSTDVVRFDFFWFAKIKADPNQIFFPQFWNLLKKFQFRPHWAKYLPPRSTEWREYLEKRYPHWQRFCRLRRKFDPDNIYLTDYWAYYFA